jgi:hypothetical protein
MHFNVLVLSRSNFWVGLVVFFLGLVIVTLQSNSLAIKYSKTLLNVCVADFALGIFLAAFLACEFLIIFKIWN